MTDNYKLALKKYFGFNDFKGGQEAAINSVINKKDSLIIMPTGGGKSICYQLPAVVFDGITLVISPLIALMKDQVDYLNSIGIETTFINSSLTNSEIQNRIYKAAKGEYKLLYIAPERLDSPSFYENINTLNISIIAIDEAHCVSHWGHDFRPSYRKISNFINSLNKRPIILALTATATELVKEDIIHALELRNPDIHVTGFDRANLNFSVIVGENKKAFIQEYIGNNKGNSGIIYASTRKEAENIYEWLNKLGYSVGIYHAGLNDEDRNKNQEAFIYDDVNIIVATNAFGMGIDKSNVRYVIHHNIPKNVEAYYQEAGRAGRDGEASECILLFNPGDLHTQRYFIDESNLSEERKAFEYKKLQAMVDYCYTSTCLRKYILEYFGEEDIRENCSNCSTCSDNRDSKDITLEAQMILSCVYRLKEKYGKNVVIDVLKGSENKKIIDYGLKSISTYGLMKSHRREDIQLILNKLIADGYINLTSDGYSILKLAVGATPVLKSQSKVFMKLHKLEKREILEEDLLGRLKRMRKDIAIKEKLPPYVIFHDSTLIEISSTLPINQQQFKTIKGVGDKKYEKYGEDFLQVIKDYIEEKGLNLENSTSEKSLINKPKNEEKIKSHIITYNMYSGGLSIEDISKERNLAKTTIEGHIMECYLEGFEVDIDSFIPEGQETIILEALKSTGAQKISDLKTILPEEITYSAIKAVIFKSGHTPS